jgi:hypothetical protein
MRPALLLCLLAAAPALAEEALPPEVREQQAREYFKMGRRNYDLGDYEAAINDFKSGYRAKPMPLFLFNIGQAANQAKKRELAIEYYQRYLESETLLDAPELAEARKHLEILRRAPEPPPAPVPAPPPPAPPVVVAEPAPPPPPRRQPAWVWGVVAGGVVVGVALGVGLGVGLQPGTTDPSLGFVRF